MGFKRAAADTLLRSASRAGIFRALGRVGRRLTVLAYHRVTDFADPAFDTYAPNVSASPAAFAAQMDHVRARFDVIDLERLLLWLEGRADLPPRPLLITFDDGYRDNYEHAYPILRERQLPAVLFVTTGFVGGGKALFWDRLARGLRWTRRTSLALEGRTLLWSDARQRADVLRALIRRLKQLPDVEKERSVDAILDSLEVLADPAAPPLSLDWAQLREMAGNGFAIGGHTHSHPVLSRLPLEQARAEITTSLARLESELQRPLRSFAYTSGLAQDFHAEHERILQELGVRAAFSLIPGPASLAEVRARPLAIRRVIVHRHDDLARFEAKLAGLARLSGGRLY